MHDELQTLGRLRDVAPAEILRELAEQLLARHRDDPLFLAMAENRRRDEDLKKTYAERGAPTVLRSTEVDERSA